MIEVLSKYIVHHVLGDCRSIGKTKWHHLVLERSFSTRPGLDAHQIVGSTRKVDFAEDMPISESIEEPQVRVQIAHRWA